MHGEVVSQRPIHKGVLWVPWSHGSSSIATDLQLTISFSSKLCLTLNVWKLESPSKTGQGGGDFLIGNELLFLPFQKAKSLGCLVRMHLVFSISVIHAFVLATIMLLMFDHQKWLLEFKTPVQMTKQFVLMCASCCYHYSASLS